MTPEMFGISWKEVLCAAFAAGGIWLELKAVRRDIARLEKKQDKYNHLQERVTRLEASSAQAHKRITELHYAHRIDKEA